MVGEGCRERSQKCVFTFTTCFPKSSSRQLKFTLFKKTPKIKRNCNFSKRETRSSCLWSWKTLSGLSTFQAWAVLKWNVKVSTPGSHTASAVCPNRLTETQACTAVGASTYELTDTNSDGPELLTLDCTWKLNAPKLKPDYLSRPLAEGCGGGEVCLPLKRQIMFSFFYI